MRKEGFTEPHYLSPVSSEHAIDNYYGDQQEYLDATKAEDDAAEAKKNADESDEE